MLSEQTIAVAEDYWRRYLDCSAADFSGERARVIAHGPELADYVGVLAFFRRNTLIVSGPEELRDALAQLLVELPAQVIASPDDFARALHSLNGTVIGPAFIGYADHGTIQPRIGTPRVLSTEDDAAICCLRAACSPADWESAGYRAGLATCGIFVGQRLVTWAGYEVWGGTIAHICVITHPEFRGRGFARRAVLQVAHRALSAGLVPQYRTLLSNAPSIGIARAIGFHGYAISVAIRLNRDV